MGDPRFRRWDTRSGRRQGGRLRPAAGSAFFPSSCAQSLAQRNADALAVAQRNADADADADSFTDTDTHSFTDAFTDADSFSDAGTPSDSFSGVDGDCCAGADSSGRTKPHDGTRSCPEPGSDTGAFSRAHRDSRTGDSRSCHFLHPLEQAAKNGRRRVFT
jgi:hypothetical protein